MSLQAYLVFPQETFGKTIRLVLLKADHMAASEKKMKGVEKNSEAAVHRLCDEQKMASYCGKKGQKKPHAIFLTLIILITLLI